MLVLVVALSTYVAEPAVRTPSPLIATEPWETRANVSARQSSSTDCSALVIAHGTNLKETVDWALSKNANGIEMDIAFDSSGAPERFFHDVPCDCTCNFALGRDGASGAENMCSLDFPVCTGSTPALELLNYIANHPRAGQLALLFIDAKIGSITSESKLMKGGREVAQLLLDTVFSAGSNFSGVVNFGIPSRDGWAYLYAGVDEFKTNGKAIYDGGRVVFGFDGDYIAGTLAVTGAHAVSTIALTLITPWRVFNTGITICSPGTFFDAIMAGAANYKNGVLSAAPGIWTLDDLDHMKEYIRYGAGSIMTNEPEDGITAFEQMGRCLATSAWRPTKATSDDVVDFTFDSGSCCLGANIAPKYSDDFSGICREADVAPSGDLMDCSPCSSQEGGVYCSAGQVCEKSDLGNKCRSP